MGSWDTVSPVTILLLPMWCLCAVEVLARNSVLRRRKGDQSPWAGWRAMTAVAGCASRRLGPRERVETVCDRVQVFRRSLERMTDERQGAGGNQARSGLRKRKMTAVRKRGSRQDRGPVLCPPLSVLPPSVRGENQTEKGCGGTKRAQFDWSSCQGGVPAQSDVSPSCADASCGEITGLKLESAVQTAESLYFFKHVNGKPS